MFQSLSRYIFLCDSGCLAPPVERAKRMICEAEALHWPQDNMYVYHMYTIHNYIILYKGFKSHLTILSSFCEAASVALSPLHASQKFLMRVNRHFSLTSTLKCLAEWQATQLVEPRQVAERSQSYLANSIFLVLAE